MGKKSPLSIINTILLLVLIVIGIIAIYKVSEKDATSDTSQLQNSTTPQLEENEPLIDREEPQENVDLTESGSYESGFGFDLELIGTYNVSFDLEDAQAQNIPDEVLEFARIDTPEIREEFENSPEGWPAMVVHVLPNPDNLDLEMWSEAFVNYTNYDEAFLFKDIEEFELDGHDGINFWWSGLGYGENYVIELGDNMLMITVHAFVQDDPIFDHADQMIQTIKFN